MTNAELQELIASIRYQVYTWCGEEAVEKIEKLIRYVETLQKNAKRS